MSRKLEKLLVAESMLMDNTIGNSVGAAHQIGQSNQVNKGSDINKTLKTELPSGVKFQKSHQ